MDHHAPAPMGVPITFSVDAAGAGEGTLELVVSTASNTVKAEVTACARGLYDVTFVPQTAEPHFVNITFNDISIDGNPFRVIFLNIFCRPDFFTNFILVRHPTKRSERSSWKSSGCGSYW